MDWFAARQNYWVANYLPLFSTNNPILTKQAIVSLEESLDPAKHKILRFKNEDGELDITFYRTKKSAADISQIPPVDLQIIPIKDEPDLVGRPLGVQHCIPIQQGESLWVDFYSTTPFAVTMSTVATSDQNGQPDAQGGRHVEVYENRALVHSVDVSSQQQQLFRMNIDRRSADAPPLSAEAHITEVGLGTTLVIEAIPIFPRVLNICAWISIGGNDKKVWFQVDKRSNIKEKVKAIMSQAGYPAESCANPRIWFNYATVGAKTFEELGVRNGDTINVYPRLLGQAVDIRRITVHDPETIAVSKDDLFLQALQVFKAPLPWDKKDGAVFRVLVQDESASTVTAA